MLASAETLRETDTANCFELYDDHRRCSNEFRTAFDGHDTYTARSDNSMYMLRLFPSKNANFRNTNILRCQTSSMTARTGTERRVRELRGVDPAYFHFQI